MASFFEELWNSIFTPGPTPTLLIATNAAFAALQLLLLILLIATYSIHFVVLSLICAGLWYSINWFATELSRAQTEQQAAAASAETDKEKDKASPSAAKKKRDRRSPEPGERGSDTETETDHPHPPTNPPAKEAFKPPPPVVAPVKDKATTATGREVDGKAVSRQEKVKNSPTLLEPGMAESSEALRRRRSLGESSGYISTDSEWEKVSEGEEKAAK